MNVGSLFTGIGGLDLGLERAGMTVVWQSEIDPYCNRVLAKHWPAVPNLGDVTRIDWSTVERPDLVCGGYPCQPFSLAGQRNGDTDPRHLWPHFATAVRHLRPRHALLENVPGHLSMGFGRVLGDLADLGYDTEWECIPAAAVGAPHLRYRVFVIATDTDQHQHQSGTPAIGWATTADLPTDTDRSELRHQPVGLRRGGGTAVVADDGPIGDVADTDPGDGRTVPVEGLERLVRGGDGGEDVADTGGAGLEGRRLRRAVGNGDRWAVEPDVGRVAHGIPHRVDRLRALGNAVVPQVAEWIGHRIMNTT